ncbi:MAG: hypothetical protein A2007_01515 [Verrucomicrobia bacterium GWC2_42_7]|nr:MAG: hypothetical protein A2007_01515 [Verrucomicrobia bacterium GWC2_42_7]
MRDRFSLESAKTFLFWKRKVFALPTKTEKIENGKRIFNAHDAAVFGNEGKVACEYVTSLSLG